MIEINNVHYIKTNKGQRTEVLQDITCSMVRGKLYSLIGEPESGKSALMHMLCGLEVPTEGKIRMDGEDISNGNHVKLRRDMVSIIYEDLLLFSHLPVFANIMYPLRRQKLSRGEAEERVYQIMEQVELPKTCANQFPKQLSYEERLRAAIARCLASNSKLILVKELNWIDSHTEDIVNLLYDLAHRSNYCVIVSTSSEKIAIRSDVIFEINEGELTTINNLTSSMAEATTENIKEEVDYPIKLNRNMITFESSYIYEDGEYRSK